MNISQPASSLFANEQVPSSLGSRSAGSPSFATTLAAEASKLDDAAETEDRQPDFTNMTRQEMRDWVNEQLRAGKMTLEVSSPFLVLTLKISAETGEPLDPANDPTRYNFLEMAERGVEGALWRNDRESAARLQDAIDIMLRNSSDPLGDV